MKLQDFHVTLAEWSRASDRDALMHVRQVVFVDELGVPGLLEEDELDPTSFHLAARDDTGQVIGTGRLTPQHRIGRLAVLPARRDRGVGTALLRQLVDRARTLGWPDVRLDAPVDAASFYAREGFTGEGEWFEERGLLHQSMRRPLRAAGRTEAPVRDIGLQPAHDRPAIDTARRCLLAETRHALAIHVPVLDSTSYADAGELAEIRRIATSGRGARIRILLHDTGAALRDGHRLLALAQRLSSVIQIRRPVEDIDLANRSAFLLNDKGGYLLLPEHDRPSGRAARNDRAGQAPLTQLFEQAWERSERATELQTLDL